MIESNAFLSLITQPTSVTAGSQTIIDHLLTYDTESESHLVSSYTNWPTTMPSTVISPVKILSIQKTVKVRILFVTFILWMAINFVMTLNLPLCP